MPAVDKRVTDDVVTRPVADDADDAGDAHESVLLIDETAMLNPFLKEVLLAS